MHVARIVVLLLLTCTIAHSQDSVKPRPSPLAIVNLRHKDAYLKITYSQPHKRNREIFGNLVPYGQIWRTGANEATEVTLTRDILLNNQILKAGTYSLFTIPEKEKWTIIINAETGLWGTYNYNQVLDVLRFEVPVQRIAPIVYEAFTIQLIQRNELADLLMLWDDVKVSIPLKFLN